MFENLIAALKAERRTIVFTEGPDARILEATARLLKDDLMDVILIGGVDEVKAAAAQGGFDIEKATIIDPATTLNSMRWHRRCSSCARARWTWIPSRQIWQRATTSAPCW